MIQPHVVINQQDSTRYRRASQVLLQCLQCSDERIRTTKSKFDESTTFWFMSPAASCPSPPSTSGYNLPFQLSWRTGRGLVHSSESSLSICVHVPCPVLWPSGFSVGHPAWEAHWPSPCLQESEIMWWWQGWTWNTGHVPTLQAGFVSNLLPFLFLQCRTAAPLKILDSLSAPRISKACAREAVSPGFQRAVCKVDAFPEHTSSHE